MSAELDTDDTGFRFYRTDYLPDLLKTKLEDVVPWFMIKKDLIPAANRFYAQGMFIARALDEENFGYCYQSFLKAESLDIEILMQWDAANGRLVNTLSDKNKLRLIHTKVAYDLFRQDAISNKNPWTVVHEDLVPKIIGKLYAERLFFVCADVANTLAISEGLKAVFDIDLKVRLHKAAAPA